MSEHWCGNVPPPDGEPISRTIYTDWTAVRGPERRRLVATRWNLFAVFEYTEVIDEPIIGYERERSDFWVQPVHKHLVEAPVLTAVWATREAAFDYRFVGPFTYARRTREFRSVER